MQETRLFVALTSEWGTEAAKAVEPLRGLPVGVKIGLELFVREGPGIVEDFREQGFPVFLDLKFHDIPFTVAGAVRSACALEPDIINVHASGGRAMMEAAAEARTGSTKVIAVTVLTSMDAGDLKLIGSTLEPLDAVTALARAAEDSGLDGVVCSPQEAGSVSCVTNEGFLIVTPGIRPAASEAGDQKRIMTPAMAIRNGATALVVGRPITGAPDPASAAGAILSEIEGALKRG